MANYVGTSGDDDFDGTALRDVFRLNQGGDDSATGDAGDDLFRMQAALTAGDEIDGGADVDKMLLKGDYSSGIVFTATTITNIEQLRLSGAFDYDLTMDDGNVAAGARLTVSARALAAGHRLVFDGSAESDGRYTIQASAGNDVLTGGDGADKFLLGKGGNDIAHGGGGQDVFLLGSKFTAADQINGGAGNDTLILDGEYNHDDAPFVITPSMMASIERIELRGAHYSNISIDDSCTAAGSTLVVDASAVGTSTTVVYIDETDAHLHAIANAGNAFFHGGTQSDIFDMRHVLSGQASTANAYGGDDTFLYGDGFKFTRTAVDGGVGNDTLSFDGDYTALRITASSSAFNVENLVFHGGHDYTGVLIEQDVTSTPGNVSGNTLRIDASELGAADVFSADLTGATSAGFDITLGAGDDTLSFAGNLHASDTIDGGLGNDTLNLDGDYSGGLTPGIANIETVVLGNGQGYNLTIAEAAVAAAANLTVDASAVLTNAVTLDASAELDGTVSLIGGRLGDTLKGGAGGDNLEGNEGADTILGGGGADTINGGDGNDEISGGVGGDALTGGSGGEEFNYAGASESSSTYRDAILDADFDVDDIDLDVGVSAFNGQVNGTGPINAATFDSDFGSAVNDSLSAHHAVVIHATSGDLIGHDFLLIDVDGDVFYDPGVDYVMDITGYTGAIDTSDFI